MTGRHAPKWDEADSQVLIAYTRTAGLDLTVTLALCSDCGTGILFASQPRDPLAPDYQTPHERELAA